MFRVDDPKHSEDGNRADSGYDSTFQVAASWQANKNLLVKVEHRGPFYAFRMMMPNAEVGEEIISLSLSLQGKIGPLSSSIAMAFKSWWKPSFTFNISGFFVDRRRLLEV